jgi:hypothetical protein
MAMTASTAVYGALDCLAFDEVWRGLLVRKARKAHDSREVMDCTVTACPGDYLLLKRREFRSRDVGHAPIHMVAPRAGAGDPAKGERDVPSIRKRRTIQIGEQRADSDDVACLTAPEIRLVYTDEYPSTPL